MAVRLGWGRLGRMAGAVALAALVAVGPAAGRASAADLDSFSGMGTGFALRVSVDLSGLPDSVKNTVQQAYAPLAAASDGALPAQFPFVIDQRFIETLSEMGATQKARALLGSGFSNFDDVESVAEVTATGEKKVTTLAQKLPSADLPIVDASVGNLLASVSAGPKVSSDGSLASVSAQLEAVAALLPADLRTAFDDLVTQINAAITDANTTLDTTLGDVANNLAAANDPVVDGLLEDAGLGSVVNDPAQLTTQLQDTVDLPSIDDVLDGNVASVAGLDNDAVTQKTAAGKVVSTATSRIASVNVLDLVRTGVINLSSTSEAAGTEGSAKNSSDCSIADVRIGGENGVAFDGKTLNVNGTKVPVPTAEVAAVKGLVDDVLEQAGLSVELCDAAQSEADADGISAAQRVSAFRIEFAPRAVADVAPLGISAGDQLVKVIVDPTVETAAAAQLAAPVSPESEPALPRTGAGSVVTILSGIGLAGAAVVARKRLV